MKYLSLILLSILLSCQLPLEEESNKRTNEYTIKPIKIRTLSYQYSTNQTTGVQTQLYVTFIAPNIHPTNIIKYNNVFARIIQNVPQNTVIEVWPGDLTVTDALSPKHKIVNKIDLYELLRDSANTTNLTQDVTHSFNISATDSQFN